MAGAAAQLEPGVHGLKRSDAIAFGHHTAGADFAGGDHLDVHAGVRQVAEHAPSGAGRCRHARTHGADAGNGGSILKQGAGPLGQQVGEGAIGGGAVVALEREADVAAAISMLPLRLHDAIEADARIGQGVAEGTGGTGFVGHVAHAHLGLIPCRGQSRALPDRLRRWAGG